MRNNILNGFVKKILLKDPQFGWAILHYYLRYMKATNLSPSFTNMTLTPGRINIMLTGKCNLRCKMCAQWGDNANGAENPSNLKDIDISLFEKIIKEASKFKPMIYLWGGEPLVHSKFNEILEILKSYKLFCIINTNGTKIEQWAQSLIDSNIAGLFISVLGTENTHNQITQSNTSYESLIRGIRYLKKLQKEQNKIRPSIQCHSIITEGNLNELDKICINAEEEGFDTIWLQSQCFITLRQGEAYADVLKKEFGVSSTLWQGFVSTPRINTSVIKEKLTIGLNALKNTMPIIAPSADLRFIDNYFSKPESYIKKVKCSIIWNQMDIQPNGDVVGCHDFQDYKVGNVTNSSILEVFNSNEYKKLRAYIHKKDFPICSKCVGSIIV